MARTNKNRVPALAYYRTSSAANVGHDKDSEKRQRHAIEGFAKRGGFEIVAEFYDAAFRERTRSRIGLASRSFSTGSKTTASAPSSSRTPVASLAG